MKKVLFFLILLLGLITFSPRKALADTGSFDATNVAWTDKTVTFTVANSAPNAQPAFSDVCLKIYPYDSGNFACTQNFTVNWPTVTATFTQDLINAQVLIGLNSNLWYISNQSFNLPHYDNGSFDATNVT